MSSKSKSQKKVETLPVVGGFFNRLGIRQKIGLGYALVVIIAVCGVFTGRMIEDFYKRQVREQLIIDQPKTDLLTKLNSTVSHVRIQQRDLLDTPVNSQLWSQNSRLLLKEASEIIILIEEVGSQPEQISHTELADSYLQLATLAEEYTQTVTAYQQALKELIQQLEATPNNPAAATALVRQFAQQEVVQKLEELSLSSEELASQFRQRTSEALQAYEQAEKLGNWLLLVSVGISVGITTIIAAYTSWAIAVPLVKTTQIAQQVTEESNFDLQVPVLTSDEIGQLALSLNHLIESVAEYTEQLHEAKEAAEAANRSKSAFLANMSHELRTPLNAIIGYSEMLYEEAVDQEYEDFLPDLQKIKTAGKHLLDMISDILDISKIEAGHVTLYLESIDVVDLMKEVATTAKPLVEKNKNTLKVQAKGKLGNMYADRPKLRQILLNLLSNAGKFTSKGLITLSVEKVATASLDLTKIEGAGQLFNNMSQVFVFRVSDTGIGMSQEQLDHIFKPFTQADASTTKKYGGTGLGLAISKRLCEILGGILTVESQLDKGSTFIAYLPERTRS